jgi:hypothetical protein
MDIHTIRKVKIFVDSMNSLIRDRKVFISDDYRKKLNDLVHDGESVLFLLKCENWDRRSKWSYNIPDKETIYDLHLDLMKLLQTIDQDTANKKIPTEGDRLMAFFKSSSHDSSSPWFKKED